MSVPLYSFDIIGLQCSHDGNIRVPVTKPSFWVYECVYAAGGPGEFSPA